MNKLIIMGRLTRNPDIRKKDGTEAVTSAYFTLAYNYSFKNNGQEETDYFNCVAFGKQAEFIEKYIQMGTMVLITGRLKNHNYMNKGGDKVYSVQVIVNEIEGVGGKTFSQKEKNQDSVTLEPLSEDTGGQ